VGQGPETLKTKGADVIEALAYTEARAKLYEYSPPTRKWTRGVFFPPIHQRHQRHRQHARFHDRSQGRSAFPAGLKTGHRDIRRFPSSDAVVTAARARESRVLHDSPVASILFSAKSRRRIPPDFAALRRALSLAVLKGEPIFATSFNAAMRASRRRAPGHPGPLARKLHEAPDRPRYYYYLALLPQAYSRCGHADSLERTLRFASIGQDGELSARWWSLSNACDRLRELSAHHDSVRKRSARMSL